MAIQLSCPCGKRFLVPDSRAGASGACPACLKPLRVPALVAAESAFAFSMPSPQAEAIVGELPDDVVTPPPAAHTAPPCVKCGTIYEPGVIFCMPCGLSLLTGQPIDAEMGDGLSRRVLSSGADTSGETMGFWAMTLGVLTRPLRTFEQFPAIVARPDMLGKMAGFYIASFAALAIVGLVMGRSRNNPELIGQVEEIERVGAVQHLVAADWKRATGSDSHSEESFDWEYRVAPADPVEAGKPFTVRLQVRRPAGAVPFDGDVWLTRTNGYGNGGAGDWFRMERVGPGEFVAETFAARDAGTSLGFGVWEAGGNPVRFVSPRLGVIHAQWQSRRGWGWLVLEDRGVHRPKDESPKIVRGVAATAGAAGAILGSLITLFISCALFTVASRVLGGGGSFFVILVTMSWLTGLVNFAQAAFVFLPAGAWVWAHYGLLAAGLLLQLLALMKVFDVDLLVALITVAISVAAQAFGTLVLLVGVLRLLGAFQE